MSPGSAEIVGAIIKAFGGLFSKGAQRSRPYFGQESAPNTLQRARIALRGASSMANDRLKSPIELPGAYAQQLPVFIGGGLPMPIGVTGVDPALSDPVRHLSIPGLFNPNPLGDTTALRRPASLGADPSAYAGVPTPLGLRRNQGDSPLEPQSDDMSSARAAVDLLLAGRRRT